MQCFKNNSKVLVANTQVPLYTMTGRAITKTTSMYLIANKTLLILMKAGKELKMTVASVLPSLKWQLSSSSSPVQHAVT